MTKEKIKILQSSIFFCFFPHFASNLHRAKIYYPKRTSQNVRHQSHAYISFLTLQKGSKEGQVGGEISIIVVTRYRCAFTAASCCITDLLEHFVDFWTANIVSNMRRDHFPSSKNDLDYKKNLGGLMHRPSPSTVEARNLYWKAPRSNSGL